jgi:gamma-glutamyltranspeptidase/glutathione hydrolase
MVVSAAPAATRAGLAVLRRGGNAIDAAVTVAFALAVAYPTAGNLGGGGFIVAHIHGNDVALDFRERAPGAATRDMYLDSTGQVTEKSLVGALAAGVPGSVAGLWEAHRKFGSRPWAELVQPAIDLAEQGLVVDSAFVEDVHGDSARLARFPSTAALLLPGGRPTPVGSTWKNPDLAAVLRRIAERGADGFYAGPTAGLIVAEMQRSGGIISLEDLKHYRALWRAPVRFDYRGHHVISMPPSSSGGLTLGLIAGILGGFDLQAAGYRTPQSIHLIAQAERRAFSRRNAFLGDPDFGPIPAAAFLSPDSAAALRATIDPASAGPPGGGTAAPEPRHTTHFSIVDARGNAVAMTTTLNEGYGSALVVTGAGFLLNDEMDDFTAKVGARNAMGLVQGERNAIAPGKRMLSSMSPTIVLDSAGTPMLVTGASGGAQIISAVASVLTGVLDFHQPLDAIMGAPQFHAQDVPDSLIVEGGRWTAAELAPLGKLGYPVAERGGALAWVQSILKVGNRWSGVSEPRSFGLALGY